METRMPRNAQVFVLFASLLTLHVSAWAQQSGAQDMQKRFTDFFGNFKEEELLEPDQAFKLKVSFQSPTSMIAELTPAPGYYLYKERIKFAIQNSSGVAIASVKLPVGERKTDPFFGLIETYKKPVLAQITLTRAPTGKNMTLVASYQGCHEKKGVCYSPIDTVLNLVLP